MFQRGLHELIASNPCVRQFTGFDTRRSTSDSRQRLDHGRPLRSGTGATMLVYADVDSLMSTFSRNTYTRCRCGCKHRQILTRFAMPSRPIRACTSKRSANAKSWKTGFKQLNAILNFVSYFVGTIMAIGATLGAVNSLYAIVDSRRRELATMRAIGFGSAGNRRLHAVRVAGVGASGRAAGMRSGMGVFQWVVGEPLRLQLSTCGDSVSRRARHRVGAGDGLDRRTTPRAACGARARDDGTARHLSSGVNRIHRRRCPSGARLRWRLRVLRAIGRATGRSSPARARLPAVSAGGRAISRYSARRLSARRATHHPRGASRLGRSEFPDPQSRTR